MGYGQTAFAMYNPFELVGVILMVQLGWSLAFRPRHFCVSKDCKTVYVYISVLLLLTSIGGHNCVVSLP